MTAPTPGERLFLRGLASHGGGQWWSADSLAAAWPADFGGKSRQQVSALGRECTRHGWAQRRRASIHERAWTEYRITPAGLAQVADSCIGGGGRWDYDHGHPCCPACGTRATPAELRYCEKRIPAHPLPGYVTQEVTTLPDRAS